MSKHISPKQKTDALILREAGYTLTVISDKTQVSVSSLKRLFDEHGTRKGGLKQDLIDKAREELINDANAVDKIKLEIASLVHDDITLIKRIRQVMADALDSLNATDTDSALQVMRAISAASVSLKSTSETYRKSLRVDKEGELADDLPELSITIMTQQEIEVIKQSAREKAYGIDDGLGGMLTDDNEENDVVEFDGQEKKQLANVTD